MGLVADLQAYRLSLGRALAHEAQGEPKTVAFLSRSVTNGLSELFTVADWRMHNAQERNLPLGVAFELQVPEALITSTQLKDAVAVQHGTTIYEVAQPSPIAPHGLDRFWRFYLVIAERA